jgi:MFS family permease
MKIGFTALVLAYVLSQFYRAFLAVLTPVLGPELGTTASDLSFASGIWFIIFAAMQIPVGAALDRIGPRVTAAVLLALGGGGGAVIFALATSPLHITLAMAAFGIGASPVLMASYFIFARVYPAALFSTLAGATIGIGSLGNLAGSAPLAYAVEAFGWRESMWALAVAAVVVALAIGLFVRDPERDTSQGQVGSVLSILTDPRVLLILPLMLVAYAPVGALRGLWAGPYFADVFGLDKDGIGTVTLAMALAMTLGAFLYGPAERLVGSKKKVVLLGNSVGALLCLVLWQMPDSSVIVSATAFAAIGLFGLSFPAIMAHGQMFIPTHLKGRGLTLLNLFGIGGVGVAQFVTSGMAQRAGDAASEPAFYAGLFALFGFMWLAGIVIYLFSTETV